MPVAMQSRDPQFSDAGMDATGEAYYPIAFCPDVRSIRSLYEPLTTVK